MEMDLDLLELVCDVIGADCDAVSIDTPREEMDEWDSLNHLRVLTAVEQEFGITFLMNEIESIDCINRLKDLIVAHSGSDDTS